jgi:chaperonin GroEL
MEDLGYADKIVSNLDTTIIFKEDEKPEETNKRISQLKVQQENATIKHEREFINERIASLAGAIGCIFVGGNSDVEQKELYDRVDDSVCAVRSALDEGIIAGGGLSLLRESISLLKKSKVDSKENDNLAKMILATALQAPINQICDNAEKKIEYVMDNIYMQKYNFGYDVKNKNYGDMFKMGIIDPLKVTKNALLNAVSVATTILSTNAIITHKRQSQSDD